MKDGVAKALLARVRHLREALEKRVRLAGDQLRQMFDVQALEQRLVTAKKAAVKEGERELHIALVKSSAISQGANAGTDAQPAVPHCLT